MRRRTLLHLAGAAALAGACSDDDDASAPTTPPAPPLPSTTTSTTLATAEASLSVSLPEYPNYPSEIVVPDQSLLDELAVTYAATLDGSPEMERFLFGEAPVVVFDRIFSEPLAELPVGGLNWILYLSGYFGGRWLRREIAAAQPEALLVSFSIDPTEAGFRKSETRAVTSLAAARADDAATLAFAESSLFDEPPPPGETEPIRGLVDNFGYNQGYLLQILEAPPGGLATDDRFQITCDRPLWCTYNSPKLAAVDRFAIANDRLAGTPLLERLTPAEEAAVPRGRFVWSAGLSVQGFSQQSYDQLLDVSSSFLETVQVTANAMVAGVLDGDVTAARQGAVANGAMIIWLAAYMTGLLNGTEPIELPTFSE